MKIFFLLKATVHAQCSCLTARTNGDMRVEHWEGPKYIAILATRRSWQCDHKPAVQSVPACVQAVANYAMC